ncbi:uncharacterized protein [Euwallacea fornicatus]|uniref:uncharacterized protein n=1 Tax=Euwallacea fornicatus TaxID=995702 RepID=UPI00338EB09C
MDTPISVSSGSSAVKSKPSEKDKQAVASSGRSGPSSNNAKRKNSMYGAKSSVESSSTTNTPQKFFDRDSNRTPSPLHKVKTWISSLSKSHLDQRDTDLYDFDHNKKNFNEEVPSDFNHKDENIIEDELKQYPNYVLFEEAESLQSSVTEGPTRYPHHMSLKRKNNIKLSSGTNTDKSMGSDLNVVVPLSPESEKKKELCSYLQLMKPTDKKTILTLQNRRSMRVRNLNILHEKREMERKLKEGGEPDAEVSISKLIEDEITEERSDTESFVFPMPNAELQKVQRDYDGAIEEEWFKEWRDQNCQEDNAKFLQNGRRRKLLQYRESVKNRTLKRNINSLLNTELPNGVISDSDGTPKEKFHFPQPVPYFSSNVCDFSDIIQEKSPELNTTVLPIDANNSPKRLTILKSQKDVNLNQPEPCGLKLSIPLTHFRENFLNNSLKSSISQEKVATCVLPNIFNTGNVINNKKSLIATADDSIKVNKIKKQQKSKPFNKFQSSFKIKVVTKKKRSGAIRNTKPLLKDSTNTGKSCSNKPTETVIKENLKEKNDNLSPKRKRLNPAKSPLKDTNKSNIDEACKPEISKITRASKGLRTNVTPESSNKNKKNLELLEKKQIDTSAKSFPTASPKSSLSKNKKALKRKKNIASELEISLSTDNKVTPSRGTNQSHITMKPSLKQTDAVISEPPKFENSNSPKTTLKSIKEKKHLVQSTILSVYKYNDTPKSNQHSESSQDFFSQILNIEKSSDDDELASASDPINNNSTDDCSDTKATQLTSTVEDQRPVKSSHTCLNAGNQRVNTNSWDLNQTCRSGNWVLNNLQKKDQHLIFVSEEGGLLLKMFYLEFNLVICQEHLVSFWTQTALGHVLGAQNMWINKGSIPRLSMTTNCVFKESLEMVVSTEAIVAYIELWTKEHQSDIREGPVADIFAIVYYWKKGHNGLDKKVLQLANINGFAADVQYSVLKHRCKIVVSWHPTSSGLESKKTFVHCYHLAADFQSIASISEFQTFEHYVSSLHTIEGSDALIMGCGENKIILWDVDSGYVTETIEMLDIKTPFSMLWVKCDRGFFFTLQQCMDGELRLIAIHGMNHSWKKLASYIPPTEFDRLKGVCVDNGVVLACYKQGIVCWNAQSSEVILETSQTDTEYISGKYIISIQNDQVTLKHAISYLLSAEELQGE